MSAVTGDDHRQVAGHRLGGGQIETLSSGRKNEGIGNVVEKVHLLLV